MIGLGKSLVYLYYEALVSYYALSVRRARLFNQPYAFYSKYKKSINIPQPYNRSEKVTKGDRKMYAGHVVFK